MKNLVEYIKSYQIFKENKVIEANDYESKPCLLYTINNENKIIVNKYSLTFYTFLKMQDIFK